MRNIAIIPARSGSKGLVNKNIKELCGKPMLAYTIEAAYKSGMFEEIMVSTDSREYAEIAMAYGANVPFLRSEKNSSDIADSWDMVEEVLLEYKEMGMNFDTFCLLQPTSPLRDEDEIIKAYQLYNKKSARGIVSVCEMEHSPKWCNTLDESLSMTSFLVQSDSNQRQKQPKYYRINGAIYIIDVIEFEETHYIYKDGTYAYIMDRKKSIDIDCELDFLIAETLMSRR